MLDTFAHLPKMSIYSFAFDTFAVVASKSSYVVVYGFLNGNWDTNTPFSCS